MQEFNFREFVRSVADKPLAHIVSATKEALQRKSTDTNTLLQEREYQRALQRLLGWLESGQRPPGLSTEEFQLYRALAANLVSRGDVHPDYLHSL